jgi:hypothetical protein
MAGLAQTLDTGAFSEGFQIAGGITVPEHALQQYLVVFHIEQWWDETSDNFTFRFQSASPTPVIDIRLGYYLPGKTEAELWQGGNTFVALPIFPTVNRLRLAPPVLSRLLQSEQVNTEPELFQRLSTEETSQYNVDCFPFRNLPTFS